MLKFANKDVKMVIITEYCMFKILLETWMIENLKTPIKLLEIEINWMEFKAK